MVGSAESEVLARHIHPNTLHKLYGVAEDGNADQVWVFGSTLDELDRAPNDVDIALFVDHTHRIGELITKLQRRFPRSRVESLYSYNASGDECSHIEPTQYPPLHLLVGTAQSVQDGVAFRRPITEQGRCIWTRERK